MSNESELKKKSIGASPSVIAKSGVWFLVCNYLVSSLGFITTPFFASTFERSELGYYSNMASWISILLIISSMEFSQSVIRFKVELAEDIDSYILSSLTLSTIWALFLYAIFCCFPDFFSNLFGIETRHIHMLFIYLFMYPAYSMLIVKHRAFYKYKFYSITTMIASVLAVASSLLLVHFMEDKVTGRLIGHYTPYVVLGIGAYIYAFVKGKKIKLAYWKYVLVLCLPLLPHLLSLYLLHSFDKIMITKICGQEYTAIYSIAYSCFSIISILFHSMGRAFMPWLHENLHIENYDEIRRVSRKYVIIFFLITVLILLFAPEFIWLLGSRRYPEAVYCMPALILGGVVQFIYTMYVNVEFYSKKTVGTAIATMTAAAVNIGLNALFIPMNKEESYVIASYTTLAGYLLLFVLHFLLVKRLGLTKVFDTKLNFAVIGTMFVIAVLVNVLFEHNLVRYIIAGVYYVFLLTVCIIKRKEIVSLFKKKKKEMPESA